MKRVKIYFQEAFNELIYKVTWPSWKDLQNSAVIVMIATAIIALIVLAMDLGFQNILSLIYGAFF
jgi:preprotein translocase subunit SecE